jgi:hypothetical protein
MARIDLRKGVQEGYAEDSNEKRKTGTHSMKECVPIQSFDEDCCYYASNSFLYSLITISFICSTESAQSLLSQVVMTARSPLMKNVVL